MDRFDLENEITNLNTIVDCLNDISYGILEGDFTKDDAVNAIDGLACLTKSRITKLFDVFLQVHKLDQYNDTSSIVNVNYEGTNPSDESYSAWM